MSNVMSKPVVVPRSCMDIILKKSTNPEDEKCFSGMGLLTIKLHPTELKSIQEEINKGKLIEVIAHENHRRNEELKEENDKLRSKVHAFYMECEEVEKLKKELEEWKGSNKCLNNNIDYAKECMKDKDDEIQKLKKEWTILNQFFATDDFDAQAIVNYVGGYHEMEDAQTNVEKLHEEIETLKGECLELWTYLGMLHKSTYNTLSLSTRNCRDDWEDGELKKMVDKAENNMWEKEDASLYVKDLQQRHEELKETVRLGKFPKNKSVRRQKYIHYKNLVLKNELDDVSDFEDEDYEGFGEKPYSKLG